MTRPVLRTARAALRSMVFACVVLASVAPTAAADDPTGPTTRRLGLDAAFPCELDGFVPIRLGSSGERVSDVQNMLMTIGYDIGGSGADGQFAPDTQSAVQQWQVSRGLPTTGEVSCQEFQFMTIDSESDFTESESGSQPTGGAVPQPGAVPEPGAAPDGFPLQVGSSGQFVQLVQSWLQGLGFSVGSSGPDGQFGPDTRPRFRRGKRRRAVR